MENITSTLPEISGVKKEKRVIGIIIFLLAIAVAYLAWYVNIKKEVSIPPAPVLAPIAQETVPSAETEASLGAGVYEQAQNPVNDKIPEGVAPVSNPIGGAYKNPFE